MMYTPYPTEIFQLPERIVFVFEGGAHVWRNIWLDGRQQPKDPNPTYLGYSTGKWERDTLIVDTMGFNDRTWLDVDLASRRAVISYSDPAGDQAMLISSNVIEASR